MPEWWIERGIGETRAVLVENGEIIEARIMLDGLIAAGTILDASLKSVDRNAVAVANGTEFLLPRGAAGITRGARIRIEVTREVIGTEGWKRPLARLTDAPPASAPMVTGRVIDFPSAADPLEEAGWSDLIEEARSGIVSFPGGELRIAVTPAMTVIDVDGSLAPTDLALAGARASAKAIRRHGIGGSIGIDFPNLDKTNRQAVCAALDSSLPPPFERTAVNGFGFLQIVRPRHHASLLELALDRPAFEARALLRAVSRQAGRVEVAAHPAVIAAILPAWTDQLARQMGGTVALRGDPGLGIGSGHAIRV